MCSTAYVWAKVLGHMEARLTPQVVSTWFDDTEILELTDQKRYEPRQLRAEHAQGDGDDLLGKSHCRYRLSAALG